MHLFYTPDIAVSQELPEEEARHCVKVLRMTEGSQLMLTDGKGFYYKACLSNAHPKHCYFEILEKIPHPPTWQAQIHIAMAPTKNLDRIEWFAEKATEIGINSLSFLNCRFSERKEIKIARIEKIMVSAMKQSQKAVLPVLNEMQTFRQFVRQERGGQKLIAHCYPGEKALLREVYVPGNEVTILIGPEGDFSEEEVAEALAHGFQAISLGTSRLRTETAALYACNSIHVLSPV